MSGAREMAALFTLRVNLPEGLDPTGDDASARRDGRPRDDGEVDATDVEAEDDATGPWQTLEFSAGNPRAEIISGRLRLYRDSGDAATSASSSGALPEGRAPVVCVLAVPSSLSVSDFCQFAAALIPKVVEMRMVKGVADPIPGEPRRAKDAPVDADADPDASASASSGSYSVILRFEDQDAADAFALNYHNRRFSSFVEGTCRVLFVRRIELASDDRPTAETDADAPSASASASASSSSRPPDGTTELPSCPVCLDRLDQDVSGVVTTICSHSFHASCLSGWGDSSCPVCRYTQRPEDEVRCHACGSAENLWACLVCGYVGCGRYADAHAVRHWKETDHCYSIELGTQRVWDYVRDGFVHRLIQSKTGLVELAPGPGRGRGARRRVGVDAGGGGGGGGGAGGGGGGNDGFDGGEFARARQSSAVDDADADDARDVDEGKPASGMGPGRSHLDHGLNEYDEDYPLDPGLEEALVSSKLDAIHTEYDQLLTNQLDSQRRYFEGLLAAATAEKEGALSAKAAAERQAEVIAGAVQDARDARNRLREAHAKIDEQAARLADVEKEREFLKSLNDTLLSNQRAFRDELDAARAGSSSSAAAKDAKIADLEEQVRDLMVFLDAQSKVEAATAEGDVIEGGTVVGVGDGADAPTRDAAHARLRDKLIARRKNRGG